MFHNNIVKISEKFLHNLHSFLLREKVKIFDFLKTND